MFKSKRPVFIMLLIVFGFSIAFSGCEPVGEELRLGEANLRIINASPEANEYSVFINDTLKTGQPLKYGEVSDYLTISAGTNSVYTEVNGLVMRNTKNQVFMQRDQNYTLFLAGKASQDSLIYVSTLDIKQVLPDTSARVRFINVSPDAKNLNLVFQKNLVDSVNVISNIPYRTASNYVKIKSSTYFMRIKKSTGAVRLANLDNYKLEAGKSYTFWTKGLVNGSGVYTLELKVLKDN